MSTLAGLGCPFSRLSRFSFFFEERRAFHVNIGWYGVSICLLVSRNAKHVALIQFALCGGDLPLFFFFEKRQASHVNVGGLRVSIFLLVSIKRQARRVDLGGAWGCDYPFLRNVEHFTLMLAALGCPFSRLSRETQTPSTLRRSWWLLGVRVPFLSRKNTERVTLTLSGLGCQFSCLSRETPSTSRWSSWRLGV